MPFSQALTTRLSSSELLTATLDASAFERRRTFAIHNPSTGQLLATLPLMDLPEVRLAISKARAAQRPWAIKDAKARSEILHNWYELITEHRADLALILTAESGKPLAEAESEIAHAAAYVRWYAEEAKRVYGEVLPQQDQGRRMLVLQQPVGVVAAITPWNFPASMVARKVAPAIAAGCSVVLKPAKQTPLVALALAALAYTAGIPRNVLSIVLAASDRTAGIEFCENPLINKISFTGSTEVGRLITKQCSEQLKKLSLELGGSAPFIVFEDADIDAAVDGALQAKFRNAGQTCVSASRFFVHRDVYDEFVEKFSAKIRVLKVGDGFDPSVSIGPMIDEKAVSKIEDLIADALRKGASIKCGGFRVGSSGTFFQPTILENVNDQMTIMREESFGPVAPVQAFGSLEEVISAANSTIYGLAAYFYTSNPSRLWRVAEELEFGMVGVNTGRMSSEAAPFGGMKQSGVGREGSHHGIAAFLELKYVCHGNI